MTMGETSAAADKSPAGPEEGFAWQPVMDEPQGHGRRTEQGTLCSLQAQSTTGTSNAFGEGKKDLEK